MRKFYQEHPLLAILLVGFILRSIAAWYNYTPMGEDDYANVMGPALQHLQTGKPIQTMEIRLPIFPRIFWALLLPLKWFGCQDVRYLVSWGLFLMGLFSLWGISAMYKLTKKIAPGQENLVGWLYALHYLLPFYGTRTFQESFTLTTVPLALYYLYREKNPWDHFWAAFFFGITAIIRHQAIILAFLFTVGYVYEAFKQKKPKNNLALYFLGGLISFIWLILLDVTEGRKPLATPIAYFTYNFGTNVKSSEYGIYPWYNYLLAMLAVFIPPFSLMLLPAFGRGCQKLKLWAIALFVFVFIHNLIANKMERFMLPVLPLFFILTIKGLEKEKNYEKIALKGFWIVNFVLLMPILFSRSQLNIIDAARYLRESPYRVVLFKIELWKQGYLGYDKPFPLYIEKDEEELLKTLLNERQTKYHILSLGPFSNNLYEKLRQKNFFCNLEKVFKPSWQEQWVIYLNPEPNKRRNASYLYLCKKEGSEYL